MKKILILGSDKKLNSEISEILNTKFEIVDASEKKPDHIIESTIYDEEIKFKNLSLIGSRFGESIPVLSCSNVITLREQYLSSDLKKNLIGISFYNGFSNGKGIEISSTEHTDETVLKNAVTIFENLKNVHFVTDRTGMIALRIICLIINEAFLVKQEGTSTEEDINTAMKLGTNYPFGPFEWCEKIGIDVIYKLLLKLHKDLGDDRYRMTPLLREMYLNSKL